MPAAYDGYYAVPVTVGNQRFYLDFDTGSSDLWLFSTLLPAVESTNHRLYDAGSSPTAELLRNYTWGIEYADCSAAAGIVYADTVDIGGMTATSQAVEAATAVSRTFMWSSHSGLLGLAYSQRNTVKPVKQKTFFDTVKPRLKEALFTVDLKHQAPGSYTFGAIDWSKYTGELVYAPVNASTGHWLVPIQGYRIGEQLMLDMQDTAIVDTGSTGLLVPPTVAAAYYDQVPQSSNYMNTSYIFPCNSTMPDFHVIIQGTQLTVPGRYFNHMPTSSHQDGFCLGGLQAATGLPFSVFGDMFLKAVFAVFDQTKKQPRLGFAAKALTT